LDQRDADPIGFLDRVWKTGSNEAAEAPKETKARCVGFKWTRGQNLDVFKHVVEDDGVRKIVLRRRNRIKTYVSEKIAQATDQWEVYSRSELVMPRPRVHVQLVELRHHIEQNEHFYSDLSAALALSNQPHLKLEFETLFDRNVQVQLFQFLEVSSPEIPPVVGSVKQNSSDLRDSIANFDELSASLADSELRMELMDCGI
jgi:hypothetical protein